MNPGVGFPDLLAQLGRGYEPRHVAEEAVTTAVKHIGSGCVLVCGEPGSGKSALAAHLIKRHGWCCHFLRAGHTEFSLWRDPYAFLTSVAFQLQAAFGDTIFPESVAITFNGTVKDVSKTGAVVGVDIERLVAVPWRRERMDVELNARGIAGDVTGVRIGELIENYRSVPLGAFRELAWFEPLRRLRELQPTAHVTLWVDGLDEELGTTAEASEDGTKQAATSIGVLLPLPSECRQLGNATVIVSSRRGPHLDRFLEDGAALVELDAPDLATDTVRVLTALIDRELAEPKTSAALAALTWPPAEVRTALLGKSEGNFLFLRQYFDAVRSGYGAALREGGLPQGLDDIHVRILSTMLRRVSENQRLDVLTLLEVLAVAQTPISAAQLARFGGVSDPAAKLVLQLLRPLLDESADENPVRFACYHKSLRDCLLGSRHATALWHVDPVKAHRRIAAAYFQADGTASQIDGYGVLHGAAHLAQAGREGAETLVALLHDGWRKFCRETTGSNRVFRHGLDLARKHAQKLSPHEACVRVFRLALADVYVRSAESQIPDEALEIMVRLGQVQRALESVPDNLEPVAFARRNAAIIRGLLADPAGDGALAARLFEQAFQKLKLRPEWLEPEVVTILDQWPLEKAESLRTIFPELEAVALGNSNGGAAALAAGARIRTVLDSPTANARFQQAFDAARTNKPNDAARIVGRIFSAWAKFDMHAAREHLHARGSFPMDPNSAAGFIELSLALENAGWQNALVDAAQILLGLQLDPDRNPLETAAVWLQVVLEAPAAWSPETTAQIVDRVQSALAEVRAARTAKEEPERISAEETALLVGLARAERMCQRSRDAQALSEAWQAVMEGASIADEDLVQLVCLQSTADGEHLEAYLNTKTDDLRDRLWFSIVRARLLTGHPGPARALERVVLGAEKPKATGWSFFFFPLAHTCRLDQLESCERLLLDVGVHAAFIGRWRLAILDRLIAEKDVRAGEWLDTTVKQWAGPRPNPNVIDELPAGIADLPDDLLSCVEAALANVISGRQRSLLRAALAARMWTQDPTKAHATFELATNEPTDPADSANVEDYVVRAFIAGQWSRCDAARGAALWQDALTQLEQKFGAVGRDDLYHISHYTHLCAMLRALHWGAPELALARLIALQEPPLVPGSRTIMLPFPSVSPFRVAGLSEHEFLIGRALVRALPKHRQLVLEVVAKSLPPGARAYALSQLVQVADGIALPQRLTWCQQAMSVAGEIDNQPLRDLLIAEAARSSCAAGARNRALDIARQTVAAMEPHFAHGETMVSHTYASALARCIAVAIRCEAWETAWNWLWQGRALGMHGFYVLAGEIPEAMKEVARVPIDRLEAAEAAGRNYYVAS